MKNPSNLRRCFLILSIGLMFSACQKDDVNTAAEPDTAIKLTAKQVELKNKMNEAARIIATFSDDKDVQQEVVKMIDMQKCEDDYVKFKDLFRPDGNSKLKSAVSMHFAKRFRQATSSTQLKSSEASDFDLEKFLVENDLVLYVPYPLEDYPESNRMPTISFHPLTNDTKSIGYIKKGSRVRKVDVVNQAYAETHPVYIITPEEEIIADGGDGGLGVSGDDIGAGEGITQFWLTKNVGPDYVTQKDVMTTIIPRMKLTGDYRGLFGGGSYVRIYLYPIRYIGNGYFEYNQIFLGETKFSRKETRKDKWKVVNITFDDDWDVTEANVLFVLVTRQRAFSGTKNEEITISKTFDYGWDRSKNEPSKASGTVVKVEDRFGKGERLKLRHDEVISREDVLANVVGNRLNNGTCNDDGIEYTIRKADKLRFYFKHHIIKNN